MCCRSECSILYVANRVRISRSSSCWELQRLWYWKIYTQEQLLLDIWTIFTHIHSLRHMHTSPMRPPSLKGKASNTCYDFTSWINQHTLALLEHKLCPPFLPACKSLSDFLVKVSRLSLCSIDSIQPLLGHCVSEKSFEFFSRLRSTSRLPPWSWACWWGSLGEWQFLKRLLQDYSPKTTGIGPRHAGRLWPLSCCRWD